MSYKLSPVPHANLWDTTIQVFSGSTTGQNVKLNSISDHGRGVAIVDQYQIHFSNPGHYLIVFSAIFSQSSGTNVEYNIWGQEDGVDIPESNTTALIKDSGTATVVAASMIVHSTGSNYTSLRWWASSANGRLLAVAAGDRPLVPSILITVNKVSN